MLDAAGTATTITEAAPPAGWSLTAINCLGIPTGGSATVNLPAGSVTLNAAATAPGAEIACEFVNTKRPTLQVAKTAQDNAGGESFSFSGNNGYGSDSITVAVANGTTNGAAKSLLSAIDTTITEAASSFYLASVTCSDQSGPITLTPNLASRSITVPAANLLPGAEVVCTFTNISPAPALSLAKSITSSGPYNAVGAVIGYSYVIGNTGNVPLTGVTLTDDKIPNAAAFTCSTPLPATIPVGGNVTCSANYTTTQADFDAGSVVNSAEASADTGAPATDSETATLVRDRELTLVKTASPLTYDSVGDVINYTYVVTNTGNVTVDVLIFTEN